jgi:hypothetical protein
MAKAAAILTGLEAKVVSFDEIGYAGEFYGIWACASRLHAASQNLHRLLDKVIRALKPNGLLYLSFKYGDAERIEDGRYFNDLNEVSLNVVLNRHPQLDVGQMCTTQDVRPERASSVTWQNAVVRRIDPKFWSDLIQPGHLWTREVLANPCPLPRSCRVYAWVLPALRTA